MCSKYVNEDMHDLPSFVGFFSCWSSGSVKSMGLESDSKMNCYILNSMKAELLFVCVLIESFDL